MEHKSLTIALKADAEGSVKAVFSTLNIIDKDGDVTVPGAFMPERVNIAAWGHNWGAMPSGDGMIEEAGNEAIFEGSFYLGTPQGDATYQTLKQRADRGFPQEWSYGFDVIEADFGQLEGRDVRFLRKLKVYEVSPVMVGAGENTRTLAVKGFDENSDEVGSALSMFVERAKERAAFRVKEGRSLSAANRTCLASLIEEAAQAEAELKQILDDADPEKGRREVELMFMEFQRQQAQLA